MTTKSNYLHHLRAMETGYLRASAANPSPGMTRTHIALHLVELRRRQRIADYYAGVEIEEG